MQLLNQGEAAQYKFSKAAFDGSTHYAAVSGRLARACVHGWGVVCRRVVAGGGGLSVAYKHTRFATLFRPLSPALKRACPSRSQPRSSGYANGRQCRHLRPRPHAPLVRTVCRLALCCLQDGHWLAEQLKATFPWLKLVISMRDPISQALAMHLHNLAHNRK